MVSVGVIVYLAVRAKMNPLVSIILAAYVFGLGSMGLGLLFDLASPVIEDLAQSAAAGFGRILSSVGLIIIFGTVIGRVMERTGAALTLAAVVLRLLGKRHPAIAMTLMGWLVSSTIYCDSGYVVLSSLKHSVARRTGKDTAVLSSALSTGLYASHTFVPPAAGPIAAAGIVGIAGQGLVWVIAAGVVVSSFAAAAGLVWALKMVKVAPGSLPSADVFEPLQETCRKLPRLRSAVAPVLAPITLMAAGSVVPFVNGAEGLAAVAVDAALFLGDPVNALLIGMLIALFLLGRGATPLTRQEWVSEALRDAGAIILIVGAGGAFGAVITATPLVDYIKSLVDSTGVTGVASLLLLFGIAALLKSAQGSSTAALIITATIAYPLLSPLGLDASLGPVPAGPVLAVMAIGAGSMVVSHVNDSYFWIVVQSANMDMSTAYRAQTLATLVEGVSALAVTLALGVLLL